MPQMMAAHRVTTEQPAVMATRPSRGVARATNITPGAFTLPPPLFLRLTSQDPVAGAQHVPGPCSDVHQGRSDQTGGRSSQQGAVAGACDRVGSGGRVDAQQAHRVEREPVDGARLTRLDLGGIGVVGNAGS